MWNCTHFRHPADEKLLLLDNFTHATTIIAVFSLRITSNNLAFLWFTHRPFMFHCSKQKNQVTGNKLSQKPRKAVKCQ